MNTETVHARIKKLQRHIQTSGNAALLVSTQNNCQYLSAQQGIEGVLLIGRRNATLFIDQRYAASAKPGIAIQDITKLPATLKRYQGKRVAVEEAISIKEFNRLKGEHAKVEWVPSEDVIESIRQQKNPEELKKIREGSQLIDQTFNEVVRYLKKKGPNKLTESELAHYIEHYGKTHGAEGVSFPPIVAWGKNSAIPHHSPTSQKISKNSFLLLDFGFTIDGYQSDFTRTIFIGTPTKQHHKIYELVRAAQQAAIRAVVDEVPAATIDHAARSLISKQGYAKNFVHSTGHGVGLQIHEAPTLSYTSTEIVRSGTVVTIEPGVYIPGKYGVRIEDMVTVGRNPKVFSTIPSSWSSMIIT